MKMRLLVGSELTRECEGNMVSSLNVIHHTKGREDSRSTRETQSSALRRTVQERSSCWDGALAESLLKAFKEESAIESYLPRDYHHASALVCRYIEFY